MKFFKKNLDIKVALQQHNMSQGKFSFLTMILHFLNIFTFVGTAFSGIIAVQMLRMDKLTFVNKLFLIYFIIDTVHGYLLGYFSFKLFERFGICFELVEDISRILILAQKVNNPRTVSGLLVPF